MPHDDHYPPAATVVPGTTTPEYAAPVSVSAGVPVEAVLSDGTKLTVYVGAAAAELGLTDLTTVTLGRESNDVVPLDEGLESTGSMRTVSFETFDPVALGASAASIVPVIRIPAAELGDIDPFTLGVARASTLGLDGSADDEVIVVLPATVDSAGGLVAADYLFADSVAAALELATRGGSKSVGSPNVIRYVAVTSQNHVNWRRQPELLRMVRAPSAADGRVSVRTLTDPQAALREQRRCTTDVVVLVHGHNEAEKVGLYGDAIDVDAPWFFAYKRDVWTPFYRYLNDAYGDDASLDCTVFYEFIYPTYRPIFTPVGDRERLDEAFARLLSDELRRYLYDGSGVRVHVVAHSMGGLVSRAGLQMIGGTLPNAFAELVTWGSPHRGGALVSLRYLLAASPPYDIRRGAVAWPLADADRSVWLMRRAVEALQIDAPGTRDLRWAREHTAPARELNFGWFLELSPAQVAEESTGAVEPAWFDLTSGGLAYSDNLRLLNTSDRWTMDDRYRFLYGVTSTRPMIEYDWWFNIRVTASEPALGAVVNPWIVADPTALFDGHPQGESDGAATVASMAAAGVGGRRRYLGDIDHEQYFGAPSSPGAITNAAAADATASATAQEIDAPSYDGRRPSVRVDPVSASSSANGVSGALLWPGDAAPGRRVQALRLRLNPGMLDADVDLGGVGVLDDGTFTFQMPSVALVDGQLPTIVLSLVDDTELTAEIDVLGDDFRADVPIDIVLDEHTGLRIRGTVSFTLSARGRSSPGILERGRLTYSFGVPGNTRVQIFVESSFSVTPATFREPHPDGGYTEVTYLDPEPVDAMESGYVQFQNVSPTVVSSGWSLSMDETMPPSSQVTIAVPVFIQSVVRVYEGDGTLDYEYEPSGAYLGAFFEIEVIAN